VPIPGRHHAGVGERGEQPEPPIPRPGAVIRLENNFPAVFADSARRSAGLSTGRWSWADTATQETTRWATRPLGGLAEEDLFPLVNRFRRPTNSFLQSYLQANYRRPVGQGPPDARAETGFLPLHQEQSRWPVNQSRPRTGKAMKPWVSGLPYVPTTTPSSLMSYACEKPSLSGGSSVV